MGTVKRFMSTKSITKEKVIDYVTFKFAKEKRMPGMEGNITKILPIRTPFVSFMICLLVSSQINW